MHSLVKASIILGTFAAASIDLRAASSYNLTIAAHSGDSLAGAVITGFTEALLLDENGSPVFIASTTTGQRLIAGGRVAVQTGDTIAGKKLTSLSSASIGKGGVLVFLAGFAGGSGIFTPDSLLVQTGDTVDGQRIFNFYRGVPTNSARELVFQATTGAAAPTNIALFYRDSAGSTRIVMQPGWHVAGKTVSGIGGPKLSESGRVAFRAEFSNSNDPNDTGVITADLRNNGIPQLVSETGDQIAAKGIAVFGYPAGFGMNDSIVVPASYSGGNGLFRVASHAGSLLVNTGSTLDSGIVRNLGLATVNGSGEAAFYASLTNGSAAIVTQGTTAVHTGDPVDLHTISAILFNATAYTDGEQIAFVAILEDGSKAVITGSPAAKQKLTAAR